MATLYKANGEVVKDVKPANGTHFELEELQKYVGGYIERIPCPQSIDGKQMALVIDEEGKLKESLHNPNASAIFWFQYPRLKNRDYVCGDALLVEEFQGAEPEDGMMWR